MRFIILIKSRIVNAFAMQNINKIIKYLDLFNIEAQVILHIARLSRDPNISVALT